MSNSEMAFADVAKLTAPAATITCNGETFTLKPFGVRKLQRALPHIAIIGSLLQVLDDGTQTDMSNIFAIVTHGGDALLDLVGLAVDKPIEWFDDADPFEVGALALAVAQVNIDFFGNAGNKLDALKKQAAGLMAQFKHAGK